MLRCTHSLLILIASLSFKSCFPDESELGFRERVAKYGYDVDEYNVTTADGYILTIFRVLHPECGYQSRPVLMIHGIMMNAITWLDAGPDASLLLLLAKKCYDVWAGTNRGTFYGRNHITLNPDTNTTFWDYCIEEIACKDLPAQVDFILNTTEANQVDFIGYSQGGGIVLALLSENADYASKFNKVIGLGPSTRITNTKSAVLRGLLTSVATVGQYVLNTGEVLKRQSVPLAGLCKSELLRFICRGFIDSLDTYNPGSLSDYTVSVLPDNIPDSISLKLAKHYYQLLIDDKFKKYDYGVRNVEVYGSDSPPIYDLTKIQNEVYFVYGLDDHMVDPVDIEWARRQIPNAKSVIVNNTKCNHVDLNFSQYAPIYVHTLIFDILSK